MSPADAQRIYLDFNATTPLAPEVAAAMEQVLNEPFGNPSSEHWAGRTNASIGAWESRWKD